MGIISPNIIRQSAPLHILFFTKIEESYKLNNKNTNFVWIVVI